MEREKQGLLKYVPRRFRPAIRNFGLLNFRLGHFRTLREFASVDAAGRPVPWYTYPAIEYVRQLDFRDRDIFEYGSGNSSLFYAARCRRITCVEDNPKWLAKIRPRAPDNCEILLAGSPEEYATAIRRYPQAFDIIIVDGSHRERCCQEALAKVKSNGFVILDNSDLLPECVAILSGGDFIQVDFVGFGPINGYLWATSFFLGRAFDFRKVHPHQPTLSAGP